MQISLLVLLKTRRRAQRQSIQKQVAVFVRGISEIHAEKIRLCNKSAIGNFQHFSFFPPRIEMCFVQFTTVLTREKVENSLQWQIKRNKRLVVWNVHILRENKRCICVCCLVQLEYFRYGIITQNRRFCTHNWVNESNTQAEMKVEYLECRRLVILYTQCTQVNLVRCCWYYFQRSIERAT